MASRLALGTVQFGLPYGIANQSGQVGRDEATAILDTAWEAGIDTLDTAIAYGNSEQVLGEIGVTGWRIISKLPPLPHGCQDIAGWVEGIVEASLQRLKVPSIHALLLHHSADLQGRHGPAIFKALEGLRQAGNVGQIGVSIYQPEELDLTNADFNFDLVQAPLNVLDRQLIASGLLARLIDAGTNVHIRSIFLQGLLLLEQSARPSKFDRWQPLWQQWQQWLDGHGLTPLQACVGFALSHKDIERIVVGVDNARQLKEIVAGPTLSPDVIAKAPVCHDLDLITPSHWRRY